MTLRFALRALLVLVWLAVSVWIVGLIGLTLGAVDGVAAGLLATFIWIDGVWRLVTDRASSPRATRMSRHSVAPPGRAAPRPARPAATN